MIITSIFRTIALDETDVSYRKAGGEIDNKPSLKVALPDFVIINDQLFVVGTYGGSEVEENIQDEIDVDAELNPPPL